jgi:hypothetical protein
MSTKGAESSNQSASKASVHKVLYKIIITKIAG